MPRRPDSGQLDLPEVFRRVQSEMLAQLKVGGLFEHASSMGAATEREWLNLFRRYLPKRYRAAPAFVIDSTGRRSRQIDIAIYDNLYSPPLFPHDSGQHIPAESIYAVFEVKPTISKQWIRDAAEKALSVRQLRRTTVPVIAGGRSRTAIRPRPILAGLLATSSVWTESTFHENVREAVLSVPPESRLELGCSLEHGSFEYNPTRSGLSANPTRTRVRNKAGNHTATQSTSRARQGGGTHPANDIQRYVGNRPATHSAGRVRKGGATHANDVKTSGGNRPDNPVRNAGGNDVHVSLPDESLIFFVLRLLDRLREMGTAPAADFMEYACRLRSLQ